MDDDDDDDSERAPPPSKRRRCTGLENGFSHMSLNAPPKGQSHMGWEQPPPTIHEYLPPLGAPVAGAVRPGSVEEPAVAPEVKMKTETWYEPEPDRVVITDLDGFIESDGEVEPSTSQQDERAFDVHPHYLDHIQSSKSRGHASQTTQLPPPSDSQALVLYRPPPPLLLKSSEAQTRARQPSPPPADEFAMDLDS